MAFVVDNSIAVAWYFPAQATPESDRAFKLLAGQTAYAPPIWRQEFAHVLKKAIRTRRITEAEAFEIIAQHESLPFFINETAAPTSELLKLALRHELSAYDASYLELALRLQLPLATKDDALRAAAKQCGIALI